MPVSVTCAGVTLERLSPRWATAMQVLASDPRVSEHLQWDPHESVEDSLSFIRDTRRLWERRAAYMFGIFLREPRQLVGSVGLSAIDRVNRRAELGTWIGVPFQGRGLNRAIKSAAFHFAFATLGLERVELLVLADNTHSLEVNRRIPGIADEGLQHARLLHNGAHHDAWMLAMTRARWEPDMAGPVELTGALA